MEKKNKTSSMKNFKINRYEKAKKKKKFLYRPFVCSFTGHSDSVLSIKRHTKHPSLFFSGGSDGQIKFWIIGRKKSINTIQAHEHFIRALAVDHLGSTLLSSSDDFSLKLWNISESQNKPKAYFENNSAFNTISTHPSNNFFVTGGKEILLWDLNKFEPIQKLIWGFASVSRIEFNPVEFNILSSCGSDRSIVLTDLRIHKPVKKIVLQMRSNDISWNVLNPWEFTVANEDSNLYSFDLRNLKEISKTYSGHVMSVLTVDQDPNSHLFASGSYDNTIRIFRNNRMRSDEIFFTQRMRRVLDLNFSLDGQYLISASEDGNLRLWKKFENKNLKYLNPIRNKKNKNKKNSQIEFKLPCLKKFPKNIKHMIYIKNIINTNEKKKNLKNSIRILPGYIKFKPKKIKKTDE